MKRLRSLPLTVMLLAGALSLPAPFAAPASQAEIVDRIVATVGKRIVTLSDVQEEYRAECFLAGKALGDLDEARVREIVGRLADRVLLRQEMEERIFLPAEVVTAQTQWEALRNRFADEAAFRRELERYGLEEQALRRRVQFQAEAQQFIEQRFRPGVQVTPEEIERYYRQELLPELRKQRAQEPPLEQVREKIAEVLAERQMNQSLAAWMEDLRRQTPIRMR